MQNAKISKTDLLKTTLELYFEYNKQKDVFRSGIDIITSILGGVVYYNKNENVISKLDDDIFFNTNIYAVYTGHKTTTDDAVGVAKKTKAYYDVLAKIGKITDKTTLAILHNKKNEFYSLIKENQTQLERLNLVDNDTKSILEFCKKQNLPAKISGSGLGDCVVVFGKYKNNDK
ncbi:MAG: hypothetical protein II670_06715, partial [Alphaproteobacteria bacterium]|nr:hypothetical protein [Alphaproteobacteria bacterium]